ncbi:Contains a weak similarity to transcription elongation factor S-II from Drosophila melanogaster gi/135660 and contains a transcription factor S-II domain PF/01096 [Arabidopsis thaliana]|uniref:DNA-directed RNA polymerase I subunit RPA12 n=1 Tax=Arabidopsis thaliana TaxID=3702 RepID=Q9LNT2_ARATH|nr:Contains a weak similarity to transcription elongation factor S-II from Drosophila melanogaster gi/135660 and contains a transcription factor S-II domain PF/01096 [Arabidopsis thaliana]
MVPSCSPVESFDVWSFVPINVVLCSLMEKSRESDILFCNLCGTMLVLKSTKYAECPLCETTRNGKEIIDKNLAYTVTTEIKKACEKCQHPELVYTTRQTRSADEGQTTYYTCPNCGHRFTEG